jgi:nitrite reductase/ring-hydroxylating ferredoxin subunit
MTAPGEWRCGIDDLPEGHTAVFRLTCGGRSVHGFAIHHAGGVHAYVNSCPHVGTTLDMWPNEFLAEDRRTIVCATHGALFEPETGACIAGPCAGDSLAPLAVRVVDREIVVTCAEE